MSSSRRATSRDVARLAEVSVATVSYVMNARTDRRIPRATRERVLAAARELGYAPNRSARSLRRRQTEQVCLVVGSIGVPAYDQLAAELHAAADQVGYGVITIVVESAERARKTVRLLHERIADGAVVAPAIPHLRAEDLTSLAQGGLPLVVMSNTAIPEGFDVVRAPEAQACDEGLDHLVGLGRRRIAFLGHEHELDESRIVSEGHSERHGAYLAALERHGLGFDERLVAAAAQDRVAAYHAVTDMLRQPNRPDGIFAASGRAAVSAIWAARDAGVRTPEDVAVLGSGNLPEGLITRPTLSTVGPATPEDFTQVARLLFDRIFATAHPAGRELTAPWSFIRRESA